MTNADENQRFRFGKACRLLKKEHYDRVFSAKQSAADHCLILYACPNDLEYPRLGLAVSRKVGKANSRNRWKRLLRESFRLSQHELPANDYICIPRYRGEPSFEMIDKSLKKLALKIQDRKGNPTSDRARRKGKQC